MITFPARPENGTDTREKERENMSTETINERITKEYGEGKLTAHNQEMARAKYVVLRPAQFDDDEVISLFEKIPTYSRDIHLTEKLRSLNNGTQQARETPRTETPPASANRIVF